MKYLPKITFSKSGIINCLKFTFFIILAGFLSAVTAGLLAGLSANIQFYGVTGKLAFDPLITIAYIIIFHYAAHFTKISRSNSAKFFLLALILSFTTNFVYGSLFLLFLIYFTHRFFPSQE